MYLLAYFSEGKLVQREGQGPCVRVVLELNHQLSPKLLNYHTKIMNGMYKLVGLLWNV
jgi:hypothetical protein